MGTLIQDVRYALRQLAATPLVTGAAVLSLGLAVGANGTIFGALRDLLLTPLPYEEPDRLVRVWGTFPDRGGGQFSSSWPNYVDFREVRSLEGLAGFQGGSYTFDAGGEPRRIQGLDVTANLFGVLGVTPVLGRTIRPEEAAPEGDRVAVLAHDLWTDAFGADPDVLGRSISLNGEPHTVVGVMPRGFFFPDEATAVWTPIHADASTWGRASGGLSLVGRLAPGATLEQLGVETAAVAERIAGAFPQWYDGMTSLVRPLPEATYGEEVRLGLQALVGAVGLLLLVACINVALLLLARGSARSREVAVRAAMGAGRKRILRLFLLEGVLVATAGGVLGVAAAGGGMALLRRAAPADLARVSDLAADPGVMAFTLLLAGATGLLFGLLPALRATRIEVASVLQHGGRGRTAGRGERRLQQGLVVAQVAFALTVLVGAGLMARTMGRLTAVDPGFRTADVLTFSVFLNGEYDEPADVSAFQHAVLDALRATPGVTAAGAVEALPLSGNDNYWTILTEDDPDPSGPQPTVGANFASPGYLEAMGIRLLRGRAFTEADRAGSPPVAVVSQAVARRLWPERNALGQRLALPGESGPERPAWREVVGVVGDVRHQGIADDPRGEMYLPFDQPPWPVRRMTFAVHAAVPPTALAPAAREAVRAADPGQAVYDLTGIEGLVRRRLATRAGLTWLLVSFGAVATLLSSVGLFGVVVHAVSRRRHEMGIRAALGAAGRRIRVEVVAFGLRPVVLGVFLGLGAAASLAGVMETLLYGVRPLDPVVFVSAPLLLLGVGLAAVWLPAGRAARADPVEALRSE